MRRFIRSHIAFGLVLFAVFLVGQSGGLDSLLRFLTANRFVLGHTLPSGDIVVVEIDAKSLSEVGVWPWPRGLHGKVVDILKEQGAEQILFDVDFSARSTPREDQLFAEALERAEGTVSLAMFQQKEFFDGDGHQGGFVNRPLDMFLENAWPGVASVPVAEDGLIWQGLYGDTLDHSQEPSLSTLMAGTETRTTGSFWIDYSIDPLDLERVSFSDVLKGQIPGQIFKDKTVLICATAQELRDLFSVPVYGILPGGIIQVLAAESIRQDRALTAKWRWSIMLLVALMVVPLGFLDKSSWPRRIVFLGLTSAFLEIGAFFVQRMLPVIPDTSASHVFIGLTAIYILTRQIGFQKILTAVSQRRADNTEQMLKQVFDDSFDAIIVVDQQLKIKMASRKAAVVFDQNFEDGKYARDFLPRPVVKELENALSANGQKYSGSRKSVELSVGGSKGRHVEYVVTTTTQMDDQGEEVEETSAASTLACLTCRDITSEREARDRLAYLARHDPLTGLLNRNAFEMDCDIRLETAEAGERFCVFCLAVDDLDGIKASLGLAYSDELLKAVADNIQHCIGEDAYAGVLHDDTFAIFATLNKERGCAEGWVVRLQAGISEEFSLDGNRVPVSISMGYAVSGAMEEGEASCLLIRQAGNALSKAKLEMRSAIIRFQSYMEDSLIRRRELEIELTRALERDELSVFYQPQVGFEDKGLLGVEALVRWNHAELGPISPAEFIPIAEESGMILDIGEWVLNRATSDLQKLGGHLLLSVNVSPRQFMHRGFYDVVKTCLERTSFPSERLKLEITESMFVGRTDDLQMRIDGIRDLGCQFALDDFGTGYSGLSQLSWFPFSWIKIDRAFVDDMDVSTSHYALVKTIVDLARAFDYKVVAEGVETEQQHELLRELGCDLGQGYFYGRPMDLDTFCKTYGLGDYASRTSQDRPAIAS